MSLKHVNTSTKSPLNSKLYKEQIDENDEDEELFHPEDKKEAEVNKSDRVVAGDKQRMTKSVIQQGKWNDLDKLITLLQNQPDDDGYFIYLKPSD